LRWTKIPIIRDRQQPPSGVTDTLLQESNIVENADRIISFAPGEGNKPLGIFLDKDSEYLSFPSIFVENEGLTTMKERSLCHTVQLRSGN